MFNDPKRREKVKLVKKKILSEIETELEKLESSPFSEGVVVRCYALYALREYINKPNTFLTFKMGNIKENWADYYVPEKDLDMWLCPDYSFVKHHLTRVLESFGNIGYSTCMAVSDNSVIDIDYVDLIGSVLFHQKKERRRMLNDRST